MFIYIYLCAGRLPIPLPSEVCAQLRVIYVLSLLIIIINYHKLSLIKAMRVKTNN